MALLFQYGSNSSTERINSAGRLNGDAHDLGWAATIDNYELRFDVWSNKNKCAASDIVQGGNHPAQGVLFEVPDYLLSRETAKAQGRKSLDQIEGTAYERRPIRVRNRNGEIIDAVTYTVRQPARDLHTSAEYVGYIITGLREHGADQDYITNIKRIATANNPQIANEIANL